MAHSLMQWRSGGLGDDLPKALSNSAFAVDELGMAKGGTRCTRMGFIYAFEDFGLWFAVWLNSYGGNLDTICNRDASGCIAHDDVPMWLFILLSPSAAKPMVTG